MATHLELPGPFPECARQRQRPRRPDSPRARDVAVACVNVVAWPTETPPNSPETPSTAISFAATNQFQIAYYGLGPTEIRIGYIALNTFVFFVGESVFWWGVPVVLAVNVLALTVLVWNTHKHLWALDKAALTNSD